MKNQSLQKYLRHLLAFATPLDFYCDQANVPGEILHIGAHTGEENEHYKELGIRSALWVEAQPDIYLQLIKNVEQQRALNAAVWSTEIEMKFNVSDNSVSSSLLKLESDHPWGGLTFSDEYKLTTVTLDSVLDHFKNLGFLRAKFFLLLDVQGAEFGIISGWQRNRNQIEAISCEVSRKNGYVGAAKRWRIVLKLIGYGYVPVASFLDSETKHGDQLFVKLSTALKHPGILVQAFIRYLLFVGVKLKKLVNEFLKKVGI